MALFGTAIGTSGKATVIPGASTPAVISVAGLTSLGLAIVGVGFGQDANVQFMHALGKKVYVYAFGERMGTLEINGVAFYRPCSGLSSSILEVLEFYKANSVSNRKTPLSVTIGGEGLTGFVKGVRTTFSDPTSGVVGFTIIMASMPEMWGT
jgi:hypothetical protein